MSEPSSLVCALWAVVLTKEIERNKQTETGKTGTFFHDFLDTDVKSLHKNFVPDRYKSMLNMLNINVESIPKSSVSTKAFF